MRYIVGAMMVIFVLVGMMLIWHGIKTLVLVILRRPYLLRAEGVITRIERRSLRTKSRRHNVALHPVIEFHTRLGEKISFRSEIGQITDDLDFLADAHTLPKSASHYQVGQTLSVLYDPENRLQPVLDSHQALWFPPIMLTGAGLIFVGGGAMIFFVFGNRIFGWATAS